MRKLNPDLLARILWAAVLVTLPVTSFRFMPFMGAGTFVRPLALYPLVLLMPILLYQIWTKRLTRPWNGSLTILLAFTLTALLATAFGSLLAPLELRGQTYFDRALRAWITLVPPSSSGQNSLLRLAGSTVTSKISTPGLSTLSRQ